MKNNIVKYKLPKTKYNEQYFLIREENDDKDSIIYYISTLTHDIIGEFNIGIYDGMCTMTYNIGEKYQNIGIGQICLIFIKNNIFNTYDVGRIVILPTNIQSKTIAFKNGFEPIKRGVYELKKSTRTKN